MIRNSAAAAFSRGGKQMAASHRRVVAVGDVATGAPTEAAVGAWGGVKEVRGEGRGLVRSFVVVHTSLLLACSASGGSAAKPNEAALVGTMPAAAPRDVAAPPATKKDAAVSDAAAPPRTTPTKGEGAGKGAGVVTRPGKHLTIPEARRYMLALINRDRASQGLAPVELDEGAPSVAGQAHAEDMARLGYLGHWGSDGSVPEQRLTEAGGADMVLENALCFTDEKKRVLDDAPLVDPKEVERAEAQFFDEVPPNDGHRRNILRPSHTRVGIGVAQPRATASELAVPCFTHEFIDAYGTYGALPRHAKVGATVHVEGTLAGGAEPTGVGIARIPLPKSLAASELNKRRSYPVPKPFQMYWRPGFVTPLPVKVDGPRFSVDVPLSERGQPGLYEVSVWAKLPGSPEQAMVGLRTVRVD